MYIDTGNCIHFSYNFTYSSQTPITAKLKIQRFIFKRLAYTLTAYCYGSKSVTQLDASSTYGTKYHVYLNKSYTKQFGQISIL